MSGHKKLDISIKKKQKLKIGLYQATPCFYSIYGVKKESSSDILVSVIPVFYEESVFIYRLAHLSF